MLNDFVVPAARRDDTRRDATQRTTGAFDVNGKGKILSNRSRIRRERKIPMAFIPSTSFNPSFFSGCHTRIHSSRSRCHVHARRQSVTMTSSLSLASSSHVSELRSRLDETRGIFGLPEDERAEIGEIIERIEKDNACTDVTKDNVSIVHGRWKLVYTTLEILGRRRISLGISSPFKQGLVELGDFIQEIDSVHSTTSNIVHFDVLQRVQGTFTINASYEVLSECRVGVNMQSTLLYPESLQKLLGKNEKMLTKIFNPTGFLDITYVDNEMRIGRNAKGQIFVLERME